MFTIPVRSSSERGHKMYTKSRLLALGLLRKTSAAEQIVLEDIATSSLKLLVSLCNVLFYRNFQLRIDDEPQPESISKFQVAT